MLIPCLWTTLPWIVLGQSYYMSFIFNNYGYGVRPPVVEAPNLGLTGVKNPAKRLEDTLELSSMDQSRGSGQKPPKRIEDTLELSSMEQLRGSGQIPHTRHNIGVDHDSCESDELTLGTKKPTKKRSTLKPSKARTTQKTSKTPKTSKTAETLKTSGTPETLKTSKTPETSETTKVTGTLETADTLEMPQEITTESTKDTEMDEEGKGTTPIAPDTDPHENTGDEWESLAPGDESTKPLDTIMPRVTWPPVTPHPPEFFDYPEANCHEEMDLHEVFGISLERDRGLATKILCQFGNSWGGPWLLMTRVELPVRIHMRHWFLGYVTDDYKDLNINFLALAHIMNQMRTAMLILGQDANDRLVYNLYDDVVISSFNDVFMMRKAELVEANATDMLFLAVGKTLSLYDGRNRTCPLQVLGSWWGNSVRQMDANEGVSCVFPRERNVTRPGYMAIFIKPSLFRNNNTAFYERMITTRRPWGLTVDTGLMEEVKNNQTEYKIRLNQQFRRTKQIVHNELERRANLFDGIEKMRRLQVERQRGR